MDHLVERVNHLTMTHFNLPAKQFIERGVKKGRHYFYLRDALGLSNKKFDRLMLALDIDVAKVKATKQDFYDLFIEKEVVDQDEIEGDFDV